MTDADALAWGMWSNTGDVDPVLARMIHVIRHHWALDPDALEATSALDVAVAGTRVDGELSRRRSLLVVDRSLRRDLPSLIRASPRDAGSAVRRAAARLEALPSLDSARSCRLAISLTFDVAFRLSGRDVLGRDFPEEDMVRGFERLVIQVAWESARYAEMAIFRGRIYQLGSAAVSGCESIALYRRDAGDLGDGDHAWAASRELALDLVINLVREAAALR